MKCHYSGGVRYVVGNRSIESLAGWPACGSGDFARDLAREGDQSDDIADVTCKRCLVAYAKHTATAALRAARKAGT